MRGGSELILTLLEGGTYLIFPLVKLILGPPLPDNYCTVPKLQVKEFLKKIAGEEAQMETLGLII